MGIIVNGKHMSGAPFSEHTKTEVVNAHGAQIQLREPVCPGQELLVKNIVTGEEITCTVIEINEGQAGVPAVGVEFESPCPRFWRVSFPPADWSPRSPEAKRFTHAGPHYRKPPNGK
jgi:hypothetical protein